jgi:uncharacterized membrane protein
MELDQTWRRIVDQVEHDERLDAAAAAIQRVGRAVLGNGAVRRVLTGVPIGHPLHPALVAVPIGAWTSASMLDLTGGNRAAARRLIGFGCLAALPTAAAGAADWLDTTGPDRRAGLVHAGVNDLALTTYIASWQSRRHGHNATGAVLALAGSGLLAVGGWLGGHLTYSRGIGVEGHRTSGADAHDASDGGRS